MSEMVSIIRESSVATGEDAQGSPTYGPPAMILVPRFKHLPVFAPKGSAESQDAFGQQVIASGTVYLPPGTVVLSTDRFTIRGDSSWHVDGEAGDWISPFDGQGKVVEVALKRGA